MLCWTCLSWRPTGDRLWWPQSSKLASEVAEGVSMGQVVVLREGEARTTSILVASVAQILLEEEFRTRAGLERLIQNNWVSLKFPISRRHGNGSTPASTAAPCSSRSSTASIRSGSSSPPVWSSLRTTWWTCGTRPSSPYSTPSSSTTSTIVRVKGRARTPHPHQLHYTWNWEQQFEESWRAATVHRKSSKTRRSWIPN